MDKYIKVDLDKIGNNVNKLVTYYSGYKYYFGVIKGFGYSHGEYVVNKIIENGINYIVVSSVEEASNVRKYNNKIPLLCLEPVYLDKIDMAIKNNITFSITNKESLKVLLDLGKKVKVHIKLDTGMNRFGLKTKEDFNWCYKKIKESKLELEGIYSHFATTGVNDKLFYNQKEEFLKLVNDIDLNEIPIVHFGRSNTLIKHPKLDFCNGVRIGISMYGFNHSVKINPLKSKINQIFRKLKGIDYTDLDCPFDLETAFTMCTKVIEVKKVLKGETIGYGGIYKAKENQYVAIIPFGYKDGFNRKNSGRLVSINGNKYQVIGDICMNLSFILIDDNVKIGDEVTLIGKDISIKYVANYLDTSSYEVLCMIKNNIPRIYYENGKEIYTEGN